MPKRTDYDAVGIYIAAAKKKEIDATAASVLKILNSAAGDAVKICAIQELTKLVEMNTNITGCNVSMPIYTKKKEKV